MVDFGAFEEKMRKADLSQAAIDAFRLNYEQLVAGVTGLVRLNAPSASSPTLQSLCTERGSAFCRCQRTRLMLCTSFHTWTT